MKTKLTVLILAALLTVGAAAEIVEFTQGRYTVYYNPEALRALVCTEVDMRGS